ncbi:MAG: hypothetical protein R3186_09205, partial [Ruegeria sp.]|nr:hypothetical protein [Ruegeria sp.]
LGGGEGPLDAVLGDDGLVGDLLGGGEGPLDLVLGDDGLVGDLLGGGEGPLDAVLGDNGLVGGLLGGSGLSGGGLSGLSETTDLLSDLTDQVGGLDLGET